MIDRDGRIVFGSLLALILVLTVSIVVEEQFGVGLREYPVLSFLVFAGLALAVPQLYLAATDDETADDDPTRSRVQFAAVATAVFALAFADDASGISYLVIAGIGSGAVIALVCYEALRWHHGSSEGSLSQAR
ncbi:hypothetical protein C477_18250 [Haloterrigena salina JCM 13891]|uniref:Uncharacterized protein n=1 Tax=Haloterrigena salina JCM 13891 TaxID=1227488 RepID=M0BVV6_9EURY|nr:hypothetical protein [Haloterrigena salina]ELZ15156.1 hypothetical protein C477_18250 [Haloterrigena salina JCM 13891]